MGNGTENKPLDNKGQPLPFDVVAKKKNVTNMKVQSAGQKFLKFSSLQPKAICISKKFSSLAAAAAAFNWLQPTEQQLQVNHHIEAGRQAAQHSTCDYRSITILLETTLRKHACRMIKKISQEKGIPQKSTVHRKGCYNIGKEFNIPLLVTAYHITVVHAVRWKRADHHSLQLVM